MAFPHGARPIKQCRDLPFSLLCFSKSPLQFRLGPLPIFLRGLQLRGLPAQLCKLADELAFALEIVLYHGQNSNVAKRLHSIKAA